MTIDLNADLGEEVTDDAALLAVVSSANVACGYHAGSVAIMRAVCEQAVVRGVSANVLDAGPVYLIDGTGTSYAVGQSSDGTGLRSLGYSDYVPRPVPAAWMDLFAPGPQLSAAAAAKRPVASDQS